MSLIAAAPDLLNSVVDLLHYVKAMESLVYQPDESQQHVAVHEANAALAKARGEKP